MRMAFVLSWVLILSGSLAAEEVLVGYLPEYRMEGWSLPGKTPLTDVVYFGIVPEGDGEAGTGAIPAQTLNRLKSAKQEGGFRLLLCAGGWDRSKGFAALSASPTARKRFIGELAEFCRQHDFDGIDFDWEHPEGAEQLAAYGTLLRETREVLAAEKRLVTMAIPAWLDFPKEVYESVDRVHLMSYDQPFPQATLETLRADVARQVRNGCPASKIAAGVPFYGRNKAGETKTYAELTGLRTFSDANDVLEGYAFNGPKTLQKKLDYVRREKLAGLMIWEIAQDSADPKTSLLRSLEAGLRRPARSSK